ncbi:hypothetical protein EGR_05492 [Echinococcus granulosus]|uniref:Uncharacterized protein n=1 Tax=Echinococcus granulosus TaxID=6210 RepID=W6UEV2_ECHGR|nr:hypothetical protein EGR_05492 [Echinococcus granulosus]EUB59593.1 hypothetical protein EGR_05492 [Echinococcus granulosus]
MFFSIHMFVSLYGNRDKSKKNWKSLIEWFSYFILNVFMTLLHSFISLNDSSALVFEIYFLILGLSRLFIYQTVGKNKVYIAERRPPLKARQKLGYSIWLINLSPPLKCFIETQIGQFYDHLADLLMFYGLLLKHIIAPQLPNCSGIRHFAPFVFQNTWYLCE